MRRTPKRRTGGEQVAELQQPFLISKYRLPSTSPKRYGCREGEREVERGRERGREREKESFQAKRVLK